MDAKSVSFEQIILKRASIVLQVKIQPIKRPDDQRRSNLNASKTHYQPILSEIKFTFQ
jgi:hypothetical protein